MSVCVALSTQSGMATMAMEEIELQPGPLLLYANVPGGRGGVTLPLFLFVHIDNKDKFN